MDKPVLSPYTVMGEEQVELEPPMLSDAYKRQLAESGVSFNLANIQDAEHPEFGDFDIYTIRLPGGLAKISMSNPDANPVIREKHPGLVRLRNALKRITDGGAEVGPYVLEYIQPREGFPFYKLSPAKPPMFSFELEKQALPMDTEKSTAKRGKTA